MPEVQSDNDMDKNRERSGYGIRRPPVSDDIHQLVVDLVDPMKSRTTTGWLKGELRARTQGRPVLGKVLVIVVAISAAIGFSVWVIGL